MPRLPREIDLDLDPAEEEVRMPPPYWYCERHEEHVHTGEECEDCSWETGSDGGYIRGRETEYPHGRHPRPRARKAIDAWLEAPWEPCTPPNNPAQPRTTAQNPEPPVDDGLLRLAAAIAAVYVANRIPAVRDLVNPITSEITSNGYPYYRATCIPSKLEPYDPPEPVMPDSQ